MALAHLAHSNLDRRNWFIFYGIIDQQSRKSAFRNTNYWLYLSPDISKVREMTGQKPDDYDHEVKSLFEGVIKVFWGLLFGVAWVGAVLNALINGTWFGIVFMIPVSILYYFVLIKKDAISRW